MKVFFGKWGWKSLLIYLWLTGVALYCESHKELEICFFWWSVKKWMAWTSFSSIKDDVSNSLLPLPVRQGDDFGLTKNLQWYFIMSNLLLYFICYCTYLPLACGRQGATSALIKAGILSEEAFRDKRVLWSNRGWLKMMNSYSKLWLLCCSDNSGTHHGSDAEYRTKPDFICQIANDADMRQQLNKSSVINYSVIKNHPKHQDRVFWFFIFLQLYVYC